MNCATQLGSAWKCPRLPSMRIGGFKSDWRLGICMHLTRAIIVVEFNYTHTQYDFTDEMRACKIKLDLYFKQSKLQKAK